MFTNLIGHGDPWPDIAVSANYGNSGTDGGPDMGFADVDLNAANPSRIIVVTGAFLNQTGASSCRVGAVTCDRVAFGYYYHSSGTYGLTYIWTAPYPTDTTADVVITWADTVSSWSLVVWSMYNAWPLDGLPYAENSPVNPALGTLVLPLAVQTGGFSVSCSFFNGLAGMYTNYTNQTVVADYHPHANRSLAHGYHVPIVDDGSRDYTFTPVGSGLNIATASVATWRKRPGFVH